MASSKKRVAEKSADGVPEKKSRPSEKGKAAFAAKKDQSAKGEGKKQQYVSRFPSAASIYMSTFAV